MRETLLVEPFAAAAMAGLSALVSDKAKKAMMPNNADYSASCV